MSETADDWADIKATKIVTEMHRKRVADEFQTITRDIAVALRDAKGAGVVEGRMIEAERRSWDRIVAVQRELDAESDQRRLCSPRISRTQSWVMRFLSLWLFLLRGYGGSSRAAKQNVW